MANIIKCTSCNRCLIAEELDDHQCSKVIDYKIDYSRMILHVYDGIGWYPFKLHSTTYFQQPDKTTSDSTESFCYSFYLFNKIFKCDLNLICPFIDSYAISLNFLFPI